MSNTRLFFLSISFILFRILPVLSLPQLDLFFQKNFHFVNGFNTHDLVDTPCCWIMSLIYTWYYFSPYLYSKPSPPLSLKSLLLFSLSLSIMSQGHGAHLVGNSIHRLVTPQDPNRTLYKLIYFLDENYGHHLWFLGDLFLWGLLTMNEQKCMEWKISQKIKEKDGNGFCGFFLTMILSLIQGVFWCAMFLEGQTVIMGNTFCFLFLVYGSWQLQRAQKFNESSLMLIFMIGCCTVTILSVELWRWYHKGNLPELHVLGLGHFREWPVNVWKKINDYLMKK